MCRRQLSFSPQLGSVSIGSYVYHGAGANAVQELAIVLATAAEYLRTLGERGLDLDLVASKLQVVLGIGENFFMEVAKFRAVKLLWAQMLRAFGVGAEGQRIRLHARSGGRNIDAPRPSCQSAAPDDGSAFGGHRRRRGDDHRAI